MRVVRAWEINGMVTRPQPDPLPISENPWNSAVLEYAAATPTDVNVLNLTLNSVYERLQAQLGIRPAVDGNTLEVRFQRIQAYNLSGGVISMDVANTFAMSQDSDYVSQHALTTVKDFDGRNHWAAVGYIWPRSQSTRPLTVPPDAGVNYILARVNIPQQQETLVRVHVLWRGNKTSSAAKHVDLVGYAASLIESRLDLNNTQSLDLTSPEVSIGTLNRQGEDPATSEPVETR